MKNFLKHARTYIFSGLLAIIPILLSVFALQLLYVLIDRRVMSFIGRFIDIRHIPGLGILLVLVCLYFIGLIVSNVVGRQFFKLIENISERIPFIKAIYGVGRQLSESLSVTGDKKAFQRAILVDYNNTGIWAVAFITGTVKDARTGEELYKVFVPAVPHLTAGFMFLVKPSLTMDPGWTVEEALKMVVSAGIISPPEIKKIETP